MGDENALHRLRFSRSRSAEATREIARKELIVAAVNEDDFAGWGFDHRSVALLNVDEVDLEHLVLIARDEWCSTP